MPLSCPKCKRINPDDALYCHEDGQALRGYQAPAHPNRLQRPFVFPTGRTCNSFDELVIACQDQWPEARGFLKSGVLTTFFGGLGRMDLAQAATEAAKYPDPDRGLDQLLARLPADHAPAALLRVDQAEVDLGTLRINQDHDFTIRLKNEGRGLLHGNVTCTDCYWLELGTAGAQKQKLFQGLDEIVIAVHVRGKVLRAHHKPLEGKLRITSSGGTATVTVRARVPVTPYPDGALAGASTPRQVAEKAKTNARQAIPLFESGAVARWYESNGWTYPVQGPTAQGLGAVQQFFEALGLTPPPKVELSQKALAFHGTSGEVVKQTLQVTTPEKRPVYAYAVSDQDWLKVGKAQMSGRAAEIPLTVTVPDRPGDSMQATLTVTANGNQKFKVPVNLTVASGPPRRSAPVASSPAPVAYAPGSPAPVAYAPGSPGPITTAPNRGLPYSIPPVAAGAVTVPVRGGPPMAGAVATMPDMRPMPELVEDGPAQKPSVKRWLPFVPVAFLLTGLLVAGVHDVTYKPKQQQVGVPPPLDDDDVVVVAKDAKELIELRFHDGPVRVTLGVGGAKSNVQGETGRRPATWDPSMRFGLKTRGDADTGEERRAKRLTFHENGLTNNVCVRVDGKEWLFGEKGFRLEGGGTVGDWPGRWREQNVPLGKDANGRQRKGARSVWVFDDKKIVITQHVEIIVGQSGDLDSCLVQYKIENEDSSEKRKVGLRFLLDTFIGNNDGVPFLIPGQEQLVNTTFEFNKTADVPDFIQARESEDLANPGTVAQLGLKLDGLDRPTRVTLGAYPDVQLNDRDAACQQEKTLWAVPVLSIQSLRPADSCVTIYWGDEWIEPGKSRSVGFTYGLGYLAAKQGKGKLALTVGGPLTVGSENTVTAYVVNPVPKQKVTLRLPTGFEFVEGDATREVPALPANAASKASPVTWKIRAPGKKGKYELEAETSNGLSQTQGVTIQPKRLFGG